MNEAPTLRDFFAANATEEDIRAYEYGPVCLHIDVDYSGYKKMSYRPLERTREQARYAYADAMIKAREKEHVHES